MAAPCKNGGRCIDGIDSFTCRCESGYTGDTCEDGLLQIVLMA